jgi:uncharacterized protein DUF3800
MRLNSTQTDSDKFVDIYVDESSQTGHRYLLFGALIVPTTSTETFVHLVRDARLPELPKGEMGWSEISRAKVAAYRRVVDLFFGNPAKIPKPFDFHCLFFDTRRTDDKAYNQGSRKIGLGKEMYELIMRCARMHRYSLFNLYPDDSEKTRGDALKLKIILNRRLAKEEQARRRLAEAGDERMRRRLAKEGEGRIDPFRRVEFRDSRETVCLQVADILTGAIGYELNGHSKKPEAADYRVALSRDIVRDRRRFGVVGNIIDGTLDWGRCTIRPHRR